MWLWFVIRCLVFVELVTAEKECSESEVKYISTECAPDGSHFIIKFPKNPSLCVVTDAPKLMKDCTQKCPVGQALNLTSNICEDCPVGTSAPGDVYEVNYWSVLPKGFYSDVFHSSSKKSCNSFGWKPQGSYLLGTSNSYCATELTLENHNIEEGLVTFQYQFNDPFLMAYFTVRNDRCVLDGGKSYILPPSSRRKWKSHTAHVPAGISTLQWYLFPENVYDSWTVTTEFKLKSVKVTGRVSTIHCSECKPGFYTNHTKSSDCEICPQNTFSGRRASSCTDCPSDEYSLPGSSSCTKRLPCVDTEYTTTYSSCSADTNMHHLTTKLIQPVICEANSPTASAKPRGPEEKCSPCPPGTKTLNGTHCVSCPTGFISANHNDSCVACPADEVPVFGIKYDTWSRMPPRLATYCLEEDVTCQPWRTNGSSIFVGPGLSSFVHSVLELELLDGFIGPKLNMPFYLDPFIRPLPGTKVVFDFELDCRANCTLTFAVDSLSETLLIQKWNGPLKRMTYTYTPGECEGASFLWLFERWSASGSKWDPASRNDKAIIYSIAVNNTRETGALGCKKCPLGIDGQFCKPCKDGLFYTMTKNATTGVERAECVPCPNGTMVIGDASDIMTVDQACIRCPPGTTAGPASDCVTDLYPEAPSGQNYDFSTLLTKRFAVSGSKLFTPQGHAFQQHFKLYLDTRFPSQRPTCINDNKQDKNITAWICRMTSSPEKNKLSDSESSFRSASLGLGDKLIKAVATNSSMEFAKEINSKLTTAGWKADDLGNDYHLFFKTKSLYRYVGRCIWCVSTFYELPFQSVLCLYL
uniref:MRH domain-containing protein n=1 Tax=Mesocestoides corti TaxID=53468 RepID=A0A5K3EM10_MESCO